MRKLLFLLILFSSCHGKTIEINGKKLHATSNSYCTSSHTEISNGYHYGYNMRSGKFEPHWGPHTTTICDEHHTDYDTVECKHPDWYLVIQ